MAAHSRVDVTIATEPRDAEACHVIRDTVFVKEQNVPADLEWDEWDRSATHFIARETTGRAVGTARFIDYAGVAKIGRVAVLADARRQSIGQQLVAAALAEARRQGFETAMLDSQIAVIPFYERLGFVAEGEVFEEAGIAHRRMRIAL